MIDILNTVLNYIFDLLLYPIKIFSPLGGLIFISIVVGILMLFIFKHTSNQDGIKTQKDYLKAHLLALRLYKDDTGLSLNAMKNLLLSNFGYLKFAVKPMFILMIPTILILIQLASWYEFRPLRVGESAILSLKLKKGVNLDEIQIKIPEGVVIETPPLRILQKNEIDWRIKGVKNGEWELKFQKETQSFSKSLFIGDGFEKLAPYRTKGNSLAGFLYPVETTLPADSFIEEISVNYPHRELTLWGWKIDWLIVFLAVSIIAGFSMKGVFKVQI